MKVESKNIPAAQTSTAPATDTTRMVFILIPFHATPSLNTEGVITHAPIQALVCLHKNAFGTPSACVLRAVL
jgi:hypothetical protein